MQTFSIKTSKKETVIETDIFRESKYYQSKKTNQQIFQHLTNDKIK